MPRSHHVRLTLIAAALLLLPGAAQAQQLTLAEALARAERGAYANRIAHAQAEAARAQALGPLRGVLPTVRIESGYVRTTDPIGAFGTALRQRRITAADFDPARLNDPAAVGNHAAALVVEQPLFHADALLGRAAAVRGAAAQQAQERWSSVTTRVQVIRAYYGAVLSAERARTLATAHEAALAHVAQAEQLARAGLVTRSDVLMAQVKAGEVEAELIAARDGVQLARAGLAQLLGAPGDTLDVPARLPGAERVQALVSAAERPAQARADVRGAELGVSAAHADVRRAQSLYLPRLSGFARYDWNSADHPYAGRENWTVGVMATWTPFAGASEWSERRLAGARAAAAQAQLEGAQANAQLEIAQAESARRVAAARLAIAERAVAQSAEAHRIVRRKYEGGLAAVVELLDAAALQTRTELSFSQARYDALVAVAEEWQARGYDPAELASALNDDNEPVDS